MQKRGLLIQQFDSCEEGASDQQEAAGDTGTELVVVAVRALKLGARDFPLWFRRSPSVFPL